MKTQPPRAARRSRLTSSVLFAGVWILALGWARSAEAINCREWTRLRPDQRISTIDRMIQSALGGSGGRQYHVDRYAIARCLEENAENIGYDFDGACSDADTAGMQALNQIFKNYIWSCGS